MFYYHRASNFTTDYTTISFSTKIRWKSISDVITGDSSLSVSDVNGGFISRDPIGYKDGMSLYSGYFVYGGLDPFGHEVITMSTSKTITLIAKGTENERVDSWKNKKIYHWYRQWEYCHCNETLQIENVSSKSTTLTVYNTETPVTITFTGTFTGSAEVVNVSNVGALLNNALSVITPFLNSVNPTGLVISGLNQILGNLNSQVAVGVSSMVLTATNPQIGQKKRTGIASQKTFEPTANEPNNGPTTYSDREAKVNENLTKEQCVNSDFLGQEELGMGSLTSELNKMQENAWSNPAQFGGFSRE